ncbi:MAG: RidA family protein [Bacteroidota bacterium]
MKTIIKTDKAPAPIGPYNQAIAVHGHLVFTSGQIPLDPKTGNIIGTTISEQTKQVCENLRELLHASHTGLAQVVKTTVYLKSMNDFQNMNEVYAQYFGSSSPARTTVEVSRLPKDVLVEIDLVAFIP